MPPGEGFWEFIIAFLFIPAIVFAGVGLYVLWRIVGWIFHRALTDSRKEEDDAADSPWQRR